MQVTNISKAKINKKVKIKPNEEIINMYDLYNYLTHDCGGKDVDLANVQAFINEHKEYENELKEAARIEGFTIGTIEKGPMDGLIKYHSTSEA